MGAARAGLARVFSRDGPAPSRTDAALFTMAVTLLASVATMLVLDLCGTDDRCRFHVWWAAPAPLALCAPAWAAARRRPVSWRAPGRGDAAALALVGLAVASGVFFVQVWPLLFGALHALPGPGAHATYSGPA